MTVMHNYTYPREFMGVINSDTVKCGPILLTKIVFPYFFSFS